MCALSVTRKEKLHMKTTIVALMFAGALVAPLAAYSLEEGTRTEKAKEFIDDAAITTKVKADFAKDRDVSALKIHVDTDHGVVKLTGNAKSKGEAGKAATIAEGVKGVVSVNNEIVVGAM
jgi:hyperosmotically inducible periplasmic protein